MKPFSLILSALFTTTLLLCSCAADPRQVPADQSAPAPRATGSGVVTGRVVAVTDDGTTKVANKERVLLIPNNAFTQASRRQVEINQQRMIRPDLRYQRNAMRVDTDADGHFRFTNVPPGNYIVSCTLSWYAGENVTVNSDGGSQMEPKYDNTDLHAEVTVRNGSTATATNWHRGQ